MKKLIIVTTEKVGFHRFEKAPDNVKFLRNIHRHKFFIKVGIEVFHNDRELEFFTVLEKLNYYLTENKNPPMYIDSCEQLATDIYEWIQEQYKVKGKGKGKIKKRKVFVEVWEDKENGARVE